MKKLHKHIFYLLIIMFSLNACQGLKDGLTGQKKKSSDEFLVEKKNPLVLPQDFDKLTEQEKLSEEEKKNENEIYLKAILTKQTNKTSQASTKSSPSGSLEKNILEKIKNN